jgi:hypothetical protein
MSDLPKRFALVCKWKGASDIQVLEYFESISEADDYLRTLPKDKERYTYEVMKYD